MAAIDFEEYGRRFVELVVTADRVEATLHDVVAGTFDTAVRMAGGLVKADGSGEVTRLEVDQLDVGGVAFRANIFVEMSLAVRISGMPYRYEGWGRVTLDLRPVLNDDLSIFIEVPDVTFSDVVLELRPLGKVAGILDQLGGVNEQVQREIVKFVNARKDEPSALKQRRIDVAETIDAEWQRRTQSEEPG
jgi:hypothetical protein